MGTFPQVIYQNNGIFLTSGDSGLIAAPGLTNLQLAAVLNTIGGGTTPSIIVNLDQQDPFGNWLPGIMVLTTLTTAGQLSYGSTTPTFLTGKYRVRWTVAGGPTTLTAALSLMGV